MRMALLLLVVPGVALAVGPGELEEALDRRHEHRQVRGRAPVERDALVEEAGHEALLALVDGVPVGVGTFHEVIGLPGVLRSEEHTSELQSQSNLVCRLLLEKKKNFYL